MDLKKQKIQVLEDFGQKAWLYGFYWPTAQDEDDVMFYELQPNDFKRAFDYGKLRVIYAERDVRVSAHSKYKNCGVFSIGNFTNWLYSHSLWNDPEELKDAILELIAFCLRGPDKVEAGRETTAETAA